MGLLPFEGSKVICLLPFEGSKVICLLPFEGSKSMDASSPLKGLRVWSSICPSPLKGLPLCASPLKGYMPPPL